MAYQLIKTKKNIKQNYEIICNEITTSIFSYLGFDFFNDLVKNNIIHIYNIKKKGNISSIITVIDYKNYNSINKKIFFYLLRKPITLIKSFIYLIKSLTKKTDLKLNTKYLHLLHLIIFKKDFLDISLKRKDLLFDKFYKKILKEHNANIFFLCFEKNNNPAYKYYTRNKFKSFYRKKDIIYLKKKFKI